MACATRHAIFADAMRLRGGAELWVLDAACGLRERGWRTGVIGAPGGPLIARARELGLDADAVPVRFDGAPWTLVRLWRLLRRRRPTAVYCVTLKDLKAVGLAARLAGVPVVLLGRESDFPPRRRFYYRWYFAGVATAIVVNSRATRAATLRGAPWLDPGRLRLLAKGVDTGRFLPRDGDPGDRPPTVGFAGQLTARKGLPELMAAWSRIERLDFAVPPRLVVAGEGPLAAELAAWRRTLRRPGRVEARGFVADMPAFYRDLDVLAVPSWSEGFGLAAAEGGACGLPVVAGDASSLPEIVVDGETGLLVPPGDPVRLARALAGLLADPARAARLGAAARARIAARFGREAMLDRLEELLAAPPASPEEES